MILPPQARHHKSSILLWMVFWPFSLLWTLIDDLIKELYEQIYQLIVNLLQSISNRAFSSLAEEQSKDIVCASLPEEKPHYTITTAQGKICANCRQQLSVTEKGCLWCINCNWTDDDDSEIS